MSTPVIIMPAIPSKTLKAALTFVEGPDSYSLADNQALSAQNS